MTTSTKNMDIDELGVKVLKGLNMAIRNLVETSAAKNESLVISDKDGNIKKVPAKELLKDLPK